MAKKFKVLVLIPTYNEVLNVEKLCDRILSLDTSSVHADIDLFFMDDESPDGTLQVIKKLANGRHKGRIFYRSGKKQGLGVAMFTSFDYFKSDFDHDILVTMDADFSHSPEQIPDLIHAITLDHADVAIGSRYVDGGLIPGTWPLSLIVRTRVAAFVARWLGGIDDSLQELTTNFRAFTRQVVSDMPYDTFEAKGYGFQLYLANHFSNNKALKVVEVPIAFQTRSEGETKSRFSDVTEFFRIAYNLNPDSQAKQTFRFITIGASGVLVNLGSLFLLSRFFSVNIALLSLLAVHLSIASNFFWHTKFTFRKTQLHDEPFFSIKTMKDFGKYELASSFTQFLTVTVFITLSNVGVYFLIAQLAGIGFAFFINYYVAKKYIWSNLRVIKLHS